MVQGIFNAILGLVGGAALILGVGILVGIIWIVGYNFLKGKLNVK